MKASKKLAAIVAAAALLTTAAACGNKEDKGTQTTTAQETTASAAAETTSSTSQAPASSTNAANDDAPLPTAADLNAIMAVAIDPAAPVEEKIATVQGGEQAPELFETMTKTKQETGADFEVVDPVLPGYSPDSVLTVVKFSAPDQETQSVKDVEFVYEDGKWKLSQSWACTLINSAVEPEQVPAMCTEMNTTTGSAAEQSPAPTK